MQVLLDQSRLAQMPAMHFRDRSVVWQHQDREDCCSTLQSHTVSSPGIRATLAGSQPGCTMPNGVSTRSVAQVGTSMIMRPPSCWELLDFMIISIVTYKILLSKESAQPDTCHQIRSKFYADGRHIGHQGRRYIDGGSPPGPIKLPSMAFRSQTDSFPTFSTTAPWPWATSTLRPS